MDLRGKRQVDICNHFGWARSTMSQYCDPLIRYKPKADRMYQLAEYLNVSPVWLMGYDVPMTGLDEREKLVKEIGEMDNNTLARFMAYMEAFKSIDDKLNNK
jgi:transcriptional regulator with XRE-family HTH domain